MIANTATTPPASNNLSGYICRMWYNNSMATLIETNPYLRDPRVRRRWLEENARGSSIFEGARGLPPVGHQSASVSRKRRSKASRKTPTSAS